MSWKVEFWEIKNGVNPKIDKYFLIVMKPLQGVIEIL